MIAYKALKCEIKVSQRSMHHFLQYMKESGWGVKEVDRGDLVEYMAEDCPEYGQTQTPVAAKVHFVSDNIWQHYIYVRVTSGTVGPIHA